MLAELLRPATTSRSFISIADASGSNQRARAIRKHNDNNSDDGDDDVSAGSGINRAKLLHFDVFRDRSASRRETTPRAQPLSALFGSQSSRRGDNGAAEKARVCTGVRRDLRSLEVTTPATRVNWRL